MRSPPVPTARLADWRRVEERVETPFAAGPVEVTTAVHVYDDERLRARIHDETGLDGRWRFFFAGCVRVRPAALRPRSLLSYVTRRAEDGFTDRLAARGFEAVTLAERRTMSVGDAAAQLRRYRGRVREGDVTLDVEGWLAVWPSAGGYLLAGGAYPTATVGGANAHAVRQLIAPETFRDELFTLIREMGTEVAPESSRGGAPRD